MAAFCSVLSVFPDSKDYRIADTSVSDRYLIDVDPRIFVIWVNTALDIEVAAYMLMMFSWWRHQMEAFSALLAICAGNSPVTGEFPAQRPVMRSFDVLFDLRLNERLSKQSWGWWFETPSRPLWRHSNVFSQPLRVTRVAIWGIPMGKALLRKIIWYYFLCNKYERLINVRMMNEWTAVFQHQNIKAPRCWPFVKGIHPRIWPVVSLTKGKWRGKLFV